MLALLTHNNFEVTTLANTLHRESCKKYYGVCDNLNLKGENINWHTKMI